MNKAGWLQAQKLFEIAVELRGDERIRFMQNIGEQNAWLQSEVGSLLSADELSEILPHSAASELMFDDDANPVSVQTKTAIDARQIIGEIINQRYLIKRKLGGGGMGEVFLAHDQNLVNREVVVKLLRSDISENPEALRKFRQEVEALARVKDESIITIYDFGTHGETPFLTMEYVAGEDLSKIISPVLFSSRDFADLESFARKLENPQAVVARHLRDKLGAAFGQILASNETDEIAAALRDGLSGLLTDWTLYDRAKFAEVKLSAQTVELLNKRERSGQTVKLNRLLLEDAFPADIKPGAAKRLSAWETAAIFRQMGIALTHGHEKGVIHRDLKPANIMICDSAARGLTVKLIDFGVAKVRESLVAPTTELASWFGTQDYMSPEQLRGERELTDASDIYALGLIAYETLVRRRVFETKSVIEQYRLQELEQFKSLVELRPDLPAAVETVICRALRFRPENRFATAVEFGEALADALNQKNQQFELDTAFGKQSAAAFADFVPSDTVPFSSAKTENARQTHPNQSETKPIEPILTEAKQIPANLIAAKQNHASSPKILLIAAAILLAALLGGGIWWFNSAANSNSNAAAPIAADDFKRELGYQLIVQKYYAGKPYQEPFAATGDEIFGDDWRFKMRLQTVQNGFLYLLGENADANGATGLTMLFPHPEKNGGKSIIKADQTVETAQIGFDKNQGGEKFWIVWAANPIPELEAVAEFVNPRDLGAIKDQAKEKAARDFLTTHGAPEITNKIVEQTDSNNRLKNLKTSAEILVKATEFRHN